MHKKTASDQPLEQRIYEAAARDEEAFLITMWKDLLAGFPAPPDWSAGRHKRPGRPRKKPQGRPMLYTWQALTLVLLLKTLHGLTYRETTSHLRANPGLCDLMGLPGAPSPKTIREALQRMSEGWLRKLNRALLSHPKKTLREDPVVGMPGWTALD